jgi:hypothetical protein
VRPDFLRIGVRTTFTLTQVKQGAHSSLRGRANAERLLAAIELLKRMGHITKNGGWYRFQETIMLNYGVPELKNGEFLMIEELPSFTEQVHWSPSGRKNAFTDPSGYFINDAR